MNYKEKLEKIDKLNKELIFRKLKINDPNYGRVVLSRYRNGLLKKITSDVEQAINEAYQVQETIKRITNIELLGKSILVELGYETKEITYIELAKIKIREDELIFDISDIRTVLNNSKEIVLEVDSESRHELKILISKSLMK